MFVYAAGAPACRECYANMNDLYIIYETICGSLQNFVFQHRIPLLIWHCACHQRIFIVQPYPKHRIRFVGLTNHRLIHVSVCGKVRRIQNQKYTYIGLYIFTSIYLEIRLWGRGEGYACRGGISNENKVNVSN